MSTIDFRGEVLTTGGSSSYNGQSMLRNGDPKNNAALNSGYFDVLSPDAEELLSFDIERCRAC